MNDYVEWEVEVSSVPGMYAQYDGVVRVWADRNADHDVVYDKAYRELKRGAFYDRDKSMWRFEKATIKK
ncbi:hypothetical protein ILS92_09640 [Acinetobacter baumannii]|nr:hypothetical protein [Acinetobacter baumannii]HCW5913679.1 hypothetical protein [Acinetobacter baumannii]